VLRKGLMSQSSGSASIILGEEWADFLAATPHIRSSTKRNGDDPHILKYP